MSKTLKPQIRFKGYDGEWTTKSLSEPEFNIQAGGDVDKTLLHTSGEYPVIANALTNDGILGYYDEIYRIKAPAISVTGRGDVGIAIPRRINFTPVVRLLALTSPHDIDFLSCAINLHPTVLESTGVPQLTVPKLQSYSINFPEKKEQKEIGQYFKLINTQIKEAEREVDRLEKMKIASLQKMFPRPDATAPEIRFAGFSEPWKESTFGEICSFSRGQGYTKSDLRKSGVPIFLYGRLYTSYSSYVKEVDTFSYMTSSAVKSKGSEVVMPSSGETAEDIAVASAILSRGIILGGGLNILNPNKNMDSVFLALMLTYGQPHYDVANRAQGKSVVHIYNDDIKQTSLMYPSLDEQRAIGEYFRNLDELIVAKRKSIVKLRNIKKACLSKMFVNDTEL